MSHGLCSIDVSKMILFLIASCTKVHLKLVMFVFNHGEQDDDVKVKKRIDLRHANPV
jgi:hypothetical protein